MEFNLAFLFEKKLSDALQIFSYQFKSLFRYLNYREGEKRALTPPENYSTAFEDKFDTDLNESEWRYAMPWGTFHPNSLHQYYDTNGDLSYVNEDGLNLLLRKSPKEFVKAELEEWQQAPHLPERFTIDVGVGHISSRRSWKYGWFEAWVKIPRGQHYWPAFWTCGVDSWPPEIDIFEAYSDKSPLYGGGFLNLPNRNLRPNLHYGSVEEGTKDDYGSYNNQVANLTDRFVQYVCHWEEDFIKIYYDGSPVFICTEKNILKWFNEGGNHFVILNHGLHGDYPENPDESSMLVRSFRVLQKNSSET
jgi:hypothetical protein